MHRKQVLALQKLLNYYRNVDRVSILTDNEYASLLAFVDIETSEMVFEFDITDVRELGVSYAR